MGCMITPEAPGKLAPKQWLIMLSSLYGWASPRAALIMGDTWLSDDLPLSQVCSEASITRW